MKARGILFSAPMVRALLAGTKTQTRRVCKAAKLHDDGNDYRDSDGWPLDGASIDGDGEIRVSSPYGGPGDRLWVREAWRAPSEFDDAPPRDIPSGTVVGFEADRELCPDTSIFGRLRPGMFMPRWASRVMLEVADVCVERLQDITRGDAMEEGYLCPNMVKGPDPVRWYAELWESINGAGSWDANPFVWAVSFSRIDVG